MWGAVIGDIVGKPYEWNSIKTKEFEFFGPKSAYTDDSVCTAAVAHILLDDVPADRTLQDWCRRHPHRGYGTWFSGWIYEESPEPYNSYGNGSAMRVSPAALLHREGSLEDALAAADRVTKVTHNHPEGMKGARATTLAIWRAMHGASPGDIRAEIEERFEYDLSRSVDDIRPGYAFDVTCQGSVPEAITCALESTSFEDAVRNAVSLGGDADTQAAIAGPIAEAMYGVPEEMIAHVKEHQLEEAPDIIAVLERLPRVEGQAP